MPTLEFRAFTVLEFMSYLATLRGDRGSWLCCRGCRLWGWRFIAFFSSSKSPASETVAASALEQSVVCKIRLGKMLAELVARRLRSSDVLWQSIVHRRSRSASTTSLLGVLRPSERTCPVYLKPVEAA